MWSWPWAWWASGRAVWVARAAVTSASVAYSAPPPPPAAPGQAERHLHDLPVGDGARRVGDRDRARGVGGEAGQGLVCGVAHPLAVVVPVLDVDRVPPGHPEPGGRDVVAVLGGAGEGQRGGGGQHPGVAAQVAVPGVGDGGVVLEPPLLALLGGVGVVGGGGAHVGRREGHHPRLPVDGDHLPGGGHLQPVGQDGGGGGGQDVGLAEVGADAEVAHLRRQGQHGRLAGGHEGVRDGQGGQVRRGHQAPGVQGGVAVRGPLAGRAARSGRRPPPRCRPPPAAPAPPPGPRRWRTPGARRPRASCGPCPTGCAGSRSPPRWRASRGRAPAGGPGSSPAAGWRRRWARGWPGRPPPPWPRRRCSRPWRPRPWPRPRYP